MDRSVRVDGVGGPLARRVAARCRLQVHLAPCRQAAATEPALQRLRLRQAVLPPSRQRGDRPEARRLPAQLARIRDLDQALRSSGLPSSLAVAQRSHVDGAQTCAAAPQKAPAMAVRRAGNRPHLGSFRLGMLCRRPVDGQAVARGGSTAGRSAGARRRRRSGRAGQSSALSGATGHLDAAHESAAGILSIRPESFHVAAGSRRAASDAAGNSSH